jgi:3,4-dihydroxy 2-butanone 4-phosphate synthase/GTP cyclohydrolase II
VHSECLTGDVFGSRRCDCGPQLQASLRTIALAGRGVVIYMQGHEGRGIGLEAKLRAYALQDAGADTVDANLRLGFPADSRAYSAAAAVLRALGVDRCRLLTNNPAKCQSLTAHGIDVVERVPLLISPNPDNASYLRTKQERLGHLLELA